MSTVVCVDFKKKCMEGSVALSASNAFKVALLNDIFSTSSVSQIAAVSAFSDISATWEVTGTGYTEGGATLASNEVVSDLTNSRAYLSAADVSWTSSTITSYGAVVWRTADSLPIVFIDFSGRKSTTSGTFLVPWPSKVVLAGQ